VLNEMADALSLVIAANGDDPSKVTDASFDRAIAKIQKAVDSGQIRNFTGNDYAPPLAKGDLAAAMSWSGDIAQLPNPHLHWNLPTDGGDIWTDNMLIPKGGDVYTASVYMNFVYDPKVAAKIEAGDPKTGDTGVFYICPVVGAKEQIQKTNPELANNELIFPTDEMLDNVHIFDANALNNEKYLTTWQNLISA
jgi:spermidine/putrescine transport system substrate-binding protein